VFLRVLSSGVSATNRNAIRSYLAKLGPTQDTAPHFQLWPLSISRWHGSNRSREIFSTQETGASRAVFFKFKSIWIKTLFVQRLPNPNSEF